jgi:outer membrane protein OmpU
MKHVLLATTALTLSAGFAAADVSWSGKANAGTSSTNAVSTTSSGIDLNVSASITTDSGVTVTVADDFGGGSLIDWNDDNAVEAQGSNLDQPAVTVAMSGVTVTIDPGEISDLYDDSQTGDVQISTSLAGFSIDYVASSDTTANTNSYKLGYSMGDLSISVAGTTRGDAAVDATATAAAIPAENEAMKWSATYAMGDITLGIAMNNNGDNDDITTGSVSYAMGNGLSVSMSADDNDDWDASVTWKSGAMSVTYSTDEASAWEAYGSYSLGGGASVFASTANTNDWSAIGVEFTF